ncbi:peptidylprolyl isomerase [Candidatus Poriferisodalis sp.]|uniref:peptidylprolyl isomerase n=1 Tax=Candidatus Poriferisodalis sp. TaxID=3101277 RepID=UPI003AF8CF6B
MSSEKRQRQRENRMRAVAQAERVKKRSTVARKVMRIVLIVAAVLVALWLWSNFTGDDPDDSGDSAVVTDTEAPDVTTFETDEPSDEAPPATEAEAETEVDDSPDDTAAAAPEPTGCPAVDGSDGPRNQFDGPHPLCIDVEAMYAATFETSMGDLTMVLDPVLDLDSVNNFVVLGRWGAFDGTLFHRIIAGFVIQGGDVQLQYGTGGPGYQFTGDFPEEDWYRIGSVAMANRGNPATNGSQFFVITGPDGASLPPLYSPLGHVVDGMDVVLAIEGVETDPADAPIDEVVVHSVTMSEATDAQINAYIDARS